MVDTIIEGIMSVENLIDTVRDHYGYDEKIMVWARLRRPRYCKECHNEVLGDGECGYCGCTEKTEKIPIKETTLEIKKDGWDSERATEFVDNLIDDFSVGDKIRITVEKKS